MDNTLMIIIAATVVLLIVITPLLFFFRRSTDVRLEDGKLVFRYPFTSEEISLENDLKSWNFQEASFIRLGKVYAINMELTNGKWKSISSRFNPETFRSIYRYLEANYSEIRKADR